MAAQLREIKKLKHHKQESVCVTRAKYRQGRKTTAVKVYTVNQESKYLLIQNVPMVGIKDELQLLCSQYGPIDDLNALDDYPTEDYTEAYCVKYQLIKNARYAKRKLDERSFFGSCLHVCYAPEFETVDETREKLNERRQTILMRLRNNSEKDLRMELNSNSNSASCSRANISTEIIPEPLLNDKPETFIWAGKTYILQNPTRTNEALLDSTEKHQTTSETLSFIPHQLKRKTLANSLGETLNNVQTKLSRITDPSEEENYE